MRQGGCRSWLLYLLLALAPGVVLAGGLRVAEPVLQGEGGRELATALQGSGLLQRVAWQVNRRVVMESAVALRLADCDAPNAWYLPELREVRLCLQLAELVAAVLAPQLEDEDQLLRAVDGTLRFILLHEIGHAVVDVLRLPITGREEDAVDQMAIWLLLGEEQGAEAVLSAATVFAANASGSADLAAAHALDEQRYFNMVCWVYGSAPERLQDLPDDWGLPAGRAAGCAEEYRRLREGWTHLLEAHAPAPPAARTPPPVRAGSPP